MNKIIILAVILSFVSNGLAQTKNKKRVNALPLVCTPACRNGATCIADPNDATRNICSCTDKFTGRLCGLPISCFPFCLNGGTCRKTAANPLLTECVCPPGFRGIDCGRRATCTPSCKNGGTCTQTVVSGVTTNTCVCQPGWTGSNCGTLINYCDPAANPCSVNAVLPKCVSVLNGYLCTAKVSTLTCQNSPKEIYCFA